MDNFIEKLKNGDRESFEKLVNDYSGKIYSFAFSNLSDREDALDAVQEIFIKIYNGISSYNGNSSLSTWIYTVAKNTCYDILRKRKNVIFEEIPETMADNKTPSPEQMYELTEKREIIKECISKLPYKYKSVLILREYEDMSYSEIAAALEISEGTVKSRISRAREHLLKLISEKMEQI